MRRREFLISAGAVPAILRGQTALDVAYAGSMTSVMEGPIKQAAARALGIEMRGRAQGASGLAALIAGGSIHPDVFISVTPGPVETVKKAGKVERAFPIARTEMVIAYNPQSRFAPQLKEGPWWRVLQQPGLRFGRTDPVTDPQGRNIIFTVQLAAGYYHQPDLVNRILKDSINPEQIFSEPSIQARLQSGQLDAASAYKIQPSAFHLPYLSLPEEINLGSPSRLQEYQHASLTVGGKTYHPEPLVYYAAALKEAAHPKEAARFVEWLRSAPAQEILRQFSYDPPGDAHEL
jgi:molybdate/tungstate transport system substrate-binding protein